MIKPARLLLPATTLLAMLSANAYGQSDYYFGKIGKFPIVVELQRDGNALSGWYFYRAQGKEIRLDGSIASDGTFHLNELADGKKTALFEGTVANGLWHGNWHKLTGSNPALPFAFEQAHDDANALDGSYTCSGKRHDSIAGGQYQSDLRWNLKLAISAGRVRTFVAGQTTRMDDKSEQACSMGLADLHQQSSKVGVLLKAKADTPDEGNPECSVKVVGDADTLLVTFGDGSKADDDCRGVGNVMFCSARGGWANFVLDRHANTCKALM